MTTGNRPPSRRSIRENCGEIGPEDGVDPRVIAREKLRAQRPARTGPTGSKAAPAPGRKAQQLGRQVGETLAGVLAGDSRDEVLRSLRVVAVTPAPDAAHLLVTVEPLPPADTIPPAEVLEHLARASGWLRTEVAAAITRRKAPALTFRVVVAGAGEGRSGGG